MFEALLAVHILAAGTWLGSGLAILATSRRTLRAEPDAFPALARPMTWWAGRAHPAAGVVLLLTGPAMVADADLEFTEPWILIALIGLFVLMGIGGALIGRTAGDIVRRLDEGGPTMTADIRERANRLLRYSALESALLALIIVDMVVKPG